MYKRNVGGGAAPALEATARGSLVGGFVITGRFAGPLNRSGDGIAAIDPLD